MQKKNIEIKMNPFADLFETDESRADNKRERLIEIPIKDISNFPNHPYKVVDDESMTELTDSISKYGLLHPVIVRPIEDGKYEMVSGHRRKRACELAGVDVIKARVIEMTKDEAILMMVDSNLQREEILPSEKAFAYKMRLDAMSRQGNRTDLTCVPVAHKLNNKKSRALLGDEVGESQDQVRRYIRLTYLSPPMLDLVDEKKIALRPAVELSYLPISAQNDLFQLITDYDCTPSHAQAIKLRKYYEEGKLNAEVMESIMEEEKPNQKEKIVIKDEALIARIPKKYSTPIKQTEFISKAVDFYIRHLEKIAQREDAR